MKNKKYVPRAHIILSLVLTLLSVGLIVGAIYVENIKIKSAMVTIAVAAIFSVFWIVPMNIKITDTEIKIKFWLRSNVKAYSNVGFKTTIIKIDDLDEIVCQSNNNNKVCFVFKNGAVVLLDGGILVNNDFKDLFEDVSRQVADARSRIDND